MKYILSILLFLSFSVKAQLTVKSVLVCEYRVYYIMSDGNMYGYSNNGGTFIKKWSMPAGVTSWSFTTGGFNYAILLDQAGNYWYTKIFTDPTDGIYELTTDSLGNAITGLFYATFYSAAQTYIRGSDSAIYYGGKDAYSLFYPGGNLTTFTGQTMNYTQLSPGGVHFKKVAMGGNTILGLTGDGLHVYKWVPGIQGQTPTIYNTVRPAIDIFSAAVDFWGYLMPAATGSQTMGYPFVAGTSVSLYGGSTAFTTPTSIQSLWGLTIPIKELAVDWNTIHYIDSTGKLYGCGWNSFGEVGNGQEFVGRYDYPGYPNYGWSFTNGEHPTGIPVQIGSKTNWKHVYKTSWFGLYTYATDQLDSVFSWGRNKANVMGNGFAANIWTPDGSNMDQFHYDALDILSPTQVTVLTARTQTYNGTPPTVDAANQNISTSSTTITATGNMLKVFAVSQPAANGVDTVCCSIISHSWTQKSGPNTATLTNTSSQTVSVSNMINGTYVFQDLISDNNSGQDTVQAQVIVSLPSGVGQWIHKKKFKSKQL